MGYVYILTNRAMPGLIKIGSTVRDSRSRARELQTTGVPEPFEVAFEIFSEEHEALEIAVHKQLLEFRVNTNREFFKYPLRMAITLLQELDRPAQQPDSAFVAESIYQRLMTAYPDWMRPAIVDVRIVQTNERVWLEITEEEVVGGYLHDQTIRRSDLAFISSGDDGATPFFRRDDTVSENARKFVEDFDPYSIAHTVHLYTPEACDYIHVNFSTHR